MTLPKVHVGRNPPNNQPSNLGAYWRRTPFELGKSSGLRRLFRSRDAFLHNRCVPRWPRNRGWQMTKVPFRAVGSGVFGIRTWGIVVWSTSRLIVNQRAARPPPPSSGTIIPRVIFRSPWQKGGQPGAPSEMRRRLSSSPGTWRWSLADDDGSPEVGVRHGFPLPSQGASRADDGVSAASMEPRLPLSGRRRVA